MEPRQTDIFSFIQEKLRIDDVEPMYTAIMRSGLSRKTRMKLCFAEGLADHLGLASRMAEGDDFWANARAYVAQGQRGGARRHFRGSVAIDALRRFERKFPDVTEFFSELPEDYFEAKRFIISLPQFGPFSAFKIADMAERTCGVFVDFSKVGLKDFAKFPQRGAGLAAEFLSTSQHRPCADWEVYENLLRYRWVKKAPPLFDRPLNAQELETCFCNYGHSKWHAPGYEGKELRKLLAGYGKLAEKIRSNCSGGD